MLVPEVRVRPTRNDPISQRALRHRGSIAPHTIRPPCQTWQRACGAPAIRAGLAFHCRARSTKRHQSGEEWVEWTSPLCSWPLRPLSVQAPSSGAEWRAQDPLTPEQRPPSRGRRPALPVWKTWPAHWSAGGRHSAVGRREPAGETRPTTPVRRTGLRGTARRQVAEHPDRHAMLRAMARLRLT